MDAVIKVGGSLLSLDDALPRTIAALEHLAISRSILVVPGGGPFADAVRAADDLDALGDDGAHWMAILGMEQFAILLASRIRNAELVHRRGEIARATVCGKIPVLAPYRWLREVDPLPHSWDVTGDSIAAWVASRVGARQLILIKPQGHDPRTAVDRHFDRARPPALKVSIVTPDMLTGSWFPD
ncbi:MAG: uridylate kinase [Gemmatimonadota bacterium]|nr:uridylate kinase [Gemmatimonadota bacterium]